MTPRFRARLFLFFRVGITLATLVVVFSQLDADQLRGALAGQSWSSVLLGISCLFAALTMSALRWNWILIRLGASNVIAASLRLYAVSLFLNQLLPTAIGGDAYRAIAARSLGIQLAAAIESVVVDRAVALATLILLTAFLIPFVRLAQQTGLASIWIPVGIVTLFVVAVLSLYWGVRAWRHRIPEALQKTFERTRGLAKSPGTWVALISLSLATHLLVGLSLWCMTSLFPQSGIGDVVLLSGLIVLVTALPLSVGGWGLREGGVVAGLAMMGVNQQEAISAALLWACAHLCLALPGGVLFLRSRRTVAS